MRVLGSRVDILTFDDALARLSAPPVSAAARHVVTTNTLMVLAAAADPDLRDIIESCALSVPESWGIRWAGRRYGTPLPDIIPGIDLMTALCREAASRGASIYLLGARPGVARAAGERLAARFPGLRVAGARDGYFHPAEAPAVVDEINRARPTYLFVGLSVPYQEKWIREHLGGLRAAVVMGVGGSLDVLSGRLRRAPGWMRRLGIEWAYRLIQEPWRWRRMKDLPVFMWKVWTDT